MHTIRKPRRALPALVLTLLLGACGGFENEGAAPNMLMAVSPEAAGPNCIAGGSKVDAGLDLDRDGALAAGEVTRTQYVCDGVAGPAGPAGSKGTHGSNGADGSDTLMLIEPDSTQCPNGGRKVTAWLDSIPDGVLDTQSERSTVSYVCDGAPGAASVNRVWVDQSRRAEPDTLYIVEGQAEVVLTLPTEAEGLEQGQVISVIGSANGHGWRIAQNDLQRVDTTRLGGSLTSTTPGTLGSISGGPSDLIELLYLGGDQFEVLGFLGSLTVQ